MLVSFLGLESLQGLGYIKLNQFVQRDESTNLSSIITVPFFAVSQTNLVIIINIKIISFESVFFYELIYVLSIFEGRKT